MNILRMFHAAQAAWEWTKAQLEGAWQRFRLAAGAAAALLAIVAVPAFLLTIYAVYRTETSEEWVVLWARAVVVPWIILYFLAEGIGTIARGGTNIAASILKMVLSDNFVDKLEAGGNQIGDVVEKFGKALSSWGALVAILPWYVVAIGIALGQGARLHRDWNKDSHAYQHGIAVAIIAFWAVMGLPYHFYYHGPDLSDPKNPATKMLKQVIGDLWQEGEQRFRQVAVETTPLMELDENGNFVSQFPLPFGTLLAQVDEDDWPYQPGSGSDHLIYVRADGAQPGAAPIFADPASPKGWVVAQHTEVLNSLERRVLTPKEKVEYEGTLLYQTATDAAFRRSRDRMMGLKELAEDRDLTQNEIAELAGLISQLELMDTSLQQALGINSPQPREESNPPLAIAEADSPVAQQTQPESEPAPVPTGPVASFLLINGQWVEPATLYYRPAGEEEFHWVRQFNPNWRVEPDSVTSWEIPADAEMQIRDQSGQRVLRTFREPVAKVLVHEGGRVTIR